ncbi:MAG: SDR family NAD(P)-dependent oxidoreductase [Gammaproteobacteria bacterium]
MVTAALGILRVSFQRRDLCVDHIREVDSGLLQPGSVFMGTVTGKSVILTGGAGEIARVAARSFLDAGAHVMLVDLDENRLREATESLKSDSVRHFVADVTSEESTASYVAATMESFGRIDVLLANAGIEGPVLPVGEYDTGAFMKVIEVNLIGVFLGIKHVFPVMKAGGGGSIVITSSIMGVSGASGLSAYNASKHAVIGLMRSCAKEGGEHNIRVNTINPAPVEGRMMRSLETGTMPDNPDSMREQLEARIPLQRYAVPGDVANLMLFLASEESRFLTGSVYMVDGGMAS